MEKEFKLRNPAKVKLELQKSIWGRVPPPDLPPDPPAIQADCEPASNTGTVKGSPFYVAVLRWLGAITLPVPAYIVTYFAINFVMMFLPSWGPVFVNDRDVTAPTVAVIIASAAAAMAAVYAASLCAPARSRVVGWVVAGLLLAISFVNLACLIADWGCYSAFDVIIMVSGNIANGIGAICAANKNFD